MNLSELKKQLVIGSGSIFIVIVLLISIILTLWNIELNREFHRHMRAFDVIERIYRFQKINDRLPNDMGEIEARYNTESGPIYYDRKSPNQFIVWFGRSLGESEVYESSSKSWFRSY